MSTECDTIRLLALEIRSGQDVVLCRQRARQIAEQLGFDTQAQTRIATAVSEIARNASQHAREGLVTFAVANPLPPSTSPPFLEVTVSDKGPGIKNLADVQSNEGHVNNRTGVGIMSAKRLMDGVELATSSTGTTVVMRKMLSATARQWSPEKLRGIGSTFSRQQPSSILEEVLSQNQELVRLMEEVQDRQAEVSRANRELEETNTGVLALYDELDTLHRVGLLLAAKVDLHPLMQALIDATTELTAAHWGICFLREVNTGSWSRSATSGPARGLLASLAASHPPEFIGTFGTRGLIEIQDLMHETFDEGQPGFVSVLSESTHFRSCLAVPVADGEGEILGALVFGSPQPGVFSERCERIVTSIAIQGVVAIEKARLFESVKAASAAKDRFLAMVSHELRTPLNPVLAIVSSLHDDPNLDPALREDIGVVFRNVQLEARLIDDLLDFHRLTNGKIELVLEPVDVHAMIQSVLQICHADVSEKRHRVVLELHASRAIISGDAARVQQILWNLLKNAIKFTPVSGTLKIRTDLDAQGRLKVSVIDDGRGISAEALPHIFNAFEQGETAESTDFGGLGLGLAIAKTFVEKHGGTVSAFSKGRDQGTSVEVCFPLLSGDTKYQLGAATAVTREGGAARAACILLVDDHGDTLSSLARLLRRCGHTVYTAASYVEAVAQFARPGIELVVSDLGLPDRSGIDLIKEIRKSSRVPAIALSGYGMESDVLLSKSAGFHDHLTKPVSLAVLQRAIQKLLS